ncbi:MAG: sigma-54 dependent transcriptional regulator [Pseudomonadota bacterium]
MQTVLIIDDNQGVRTALTMLFSLHDIDAVAASTPDEGLERVAAGGVDLVVQDMNFSADTTSGEEGVALFHAIREREPALPVILLTAWTHLETAVELVRAGAADYLAKPWDDARLLTTARNLLKLRQVTREKDALSVERRRARADLAAQFDLGGLVYESEAIHQLLLVATQVAPSKVPVLITGANGAGKEKLADVVQANSSAAAGPYVKVNIGALPGDLLEAELFGAEAGAFTGARERREGRFEAAHGGTLFLDEIGTLSPEGQTRLLRVLQTGEFERLGSSQTRRVDVRVISATNLDIPAAIRAGEFREDLYYRLNLIELELPGLADRPDDILPLAEFFLDGEHRLDDDARAALLSYPWPGNVRELGNCIQRACLLARQPVIGVNDLRLNLQDTVRSGDGEPDSAAIREALDACGGVVAKAARKLGLSRQALYRRMEKHRIGKETGS